MMQQNSSQYLTLAKEYVKELHSMTGEPMPDLQEIEDKYFCYVFDDNLVVKLIKDNGNTIGFIIFERIEETNIPFDWYIMETYISPEYRGYGLVRQALIDFKNHQDVKAFGYVVLDKNPNADAYWKRRFDEINFTVKRADEYFSQFDGVKGYIAKSPTCHDKAIYLWRA